MPFNVGDVVKVRRNDLLRGAGQSAKIMQVLPDRADRVREYVVQFDSPPTFRSSDRFLFCIYREEELIG